MAIAIDGTSGVTFGTSKTIGTLSHVITSNTGGLLYVAVPWGGTATGVNSITFAGTAFGGTIGTLASGNNRLAAFYFSNPPIGTNNIIVTMSGPTRTLNMGGVSLTGVNTISPIGTIKGGTTTSGTVISGTITTQNNNSYIVNPTSAAQGWTSGAGVTINAIAGQTQSFTVGTGISAVGWYQGANSYKGPISPAGNGTLTNNLGSRTGQGTITAIQYLIEINALVSGVGTNLIQSAGTSGVGLGTTSVTWPSPTTTGNLAVVGVALTNAATLGTVISITDTQGNTYNKAASLAGTGAVVLDAELWYSKLGTGGAGSVTVQNTVDNGAIYIREYSGFNTLDVAGSALGSSNAPNTGTITTNYSPELLIVATGDNNGAGQTYTAAGIFGDMVGTTTTLTGLSMEDGTANAGAQTGTLTLGSVTNWNSLMAAFYNLVPSAGVPGYMTLLGVGS